MKSEDQRDQKTVFRNTVNIGAFSLRNSRYDWNSANFTMSWWTSCTC